MASGPEQEFDGLDEILQAAFTPERPESEPPEEMTLADQRYEIGSEIARGGQGIVYRARDVHLDRPVALKILTSLHGSSERRIARFRREARVASRLNHPGICAVYDHGTRYGVPYITMPLLEGESLAAKIARSRWEREERVTKLDDTRTRSTATASDGLAQIVELVEKTALALHAAHGEGVIHRDVKPGNIMVTEEGVPILLDFGLARDTESPNPTVTQTGEVFGTPAYMSPEQLAPDGEEIDHRTDIYSLGAVLFEALTLERPFDDDMTLRRDAVAPNPRRLNPSISRDLSVVIETALDPERRRRYKTALAFAEDLRRVLSLEPIHARPASVPLRIRRWVQRNPMQTFFWLALVAGAAASVAFAIGMQDARDEAKRHLAEWELLADVGRAELLVQEARHDLWPCVPTRIEAMREWIRRADTLIAKLPRHRRRVTEIEAAALPIDEARNRAAHQETLLLAGTLDLQIESARALLDKLEPGTRRYENAEEKLQAHVDRRERLEEVLRQRVVWDFADDTDRWRHAQQRRIVSAVEQLAQDRLHGPTRTAMKRRLALAESVHLETVARQADEWQRVAASVRADSRFEELELSPQVGLVPVGPDRKSGLEEFSILHTGKTPERDPATGKLRIDGETGVVLVLVPGGDGWMGAQSSNPSAPHYLAMATQVYEPIHRVRLAPFFVSKYEMTQEQWKRLTGKNPSFRRPLVESHPVEMVSWNDCVDVLNRFGCTLPTETQWEYACRAGTRTRWSTGDDVKSLFGHANLADEAGQRDWGVGRRRIVVGLDDGHVDHAPVGTYLPNPWGLHDIHGNVWEICLDCPEYGLPPQRSDGRRPSIKGTNKHTVRGGSYLGDAAYASSATRNFHGPDHRFHDVGVRPVRAIE